MSNNITMKDIAQQLGVSTVTVSKALSGKEGVSDSVRELIKLKSEEMGYRYNFLGKSMKEGKNYNIGILVADRFMHDSAFYSKIYQRLMKDLVTFNYFGIIEIISEEAEEEALLPQILQNNKVDGIIFLGQMNRRYIENVKATNIPIIFLDFTDDHFCVDTIVSDNFYGSYEITKYLISKGHTKIGFVGKLDATSSIMDRYIGYYRALLQNKIQLKEEWVLSDRDDRGKLCEVKLPEHMPTAFVCNCDEVAYKFILQLKKTGYLVPEDISVVGYDNYIYATLSNPQITTMEVNVDVMSEIAVNSIIKRIKNPDIEYGRKVVSGRIVVRDSVVDNVRK